jgi:uncharacterized protein YcgL (UPF0745 family)
MVQVFRTNVSHHFDAIRLKELLAKEFPKAIFLFDLLDKDKLLRVEGYSVPVSRVVQVIKHQGFYCEVVETKIEP